jgi:hypothetical protein
VVEHGSMVRLNKALLNLISEAEEIHDELKLACVLIEIRFRQLFLARTIDVFYH